MMDNIEKKRTTGFQGVQGYKLDIKRDMQIGSIKTRTRSWKHISLNGKYEPDHRLFS